MKQVLKWGAETSAKTDAAVGGVPIKTEKEAKEWRKLNKRFEEMHNANYWDSTPETQRNYEKAISDMNKYEKHLREKYFPL